MLVCFGRLLREVKSEEELQEKLLAAEAQINELKTRLNDANNKLKHVDTENAVSLKTRHKIIGCVSVVRRFYSLKVYVHFH